MSETDITGNPEEEFPPISSGIPGDSKGVDPATLLGTEIGPYKLLSILGEGGYGVVYLAEQRQPVKRRVALKLIKPGMDSKEVLARFEAERQALALLDHPNIAHVFEAGASSAGHPYFAMEYVDGVSITEYCDRYKLSIEARLRLFKEVCSAIQYAHEKGIIHRDIKPSNILISQQGQKAVPKVIDFGIAKAVNLPLTERTLFTERGQLLGTPEYMSPEQADMAIQNIDTRSDIYSLGAVLYVLLAGTPAFDRKSLEQAGFSEIQRILREQDPPRPSTRITSLGQEAEKIARSRSTEVITLARRLHKELEWIPLKAMRKERERRYRSAGELSDDIENYLNGAPLIAGPESSLYRLNKFVRKHIKSVAATVTIILVLVLGLVISTKMYLKAKEAREQEAIARTQAQQSENIARQKAEDYRHALYFNSTVLAETFYRYGHISNVLKILESCPTDLRGWEWYYLNRISNQAHLTITMPGRHAASVSFSPDSKRIVSGGWDHKIIIWDAVTGKQLLTLRGHKGRVGSVDFSPDGKRIVSGSQDKTIKIWDAAKGIELMTLYGHEGPVNAQFSPDGNRVISVSYDGTIRLWDSVSGENLITFRGQGPVAMSPDGNRIASCSQDKTIKIWDPSTGAELLKLIGHTNRVYSVAFSPDSKKIVSGGRDRMIILWDATTGREIRTFHGHRSRVKSVGFSPDGKQIVSSGSWDNMIKLWDVATGEEIMTLRGHRGHISYAKFSPNGDKIVSIGDDSTIKVWDLATCDNITQFKYHSGQVHCVTFSPDGKRIASGGDDNFVKVFEASNGKELLTLHGHNDEIASLAFSPDGTKIATGSYDDTCRIWDSTTGVELMKLPYQEGTVNTLAFSPDGRKIVSGCGDNIIYVWDATNGTELMRFLGHDDEVSSVAFSPDGKRIISGSWDGTVKIWDAVTGTELTSLDADVDFGSINCVMFSPDGEQILAATEFSGIRLWNAETEAKVITFGRDDLDIASAAFSPDGKRIVAASVYDGTIRIWDAVSGALTMTLRGRYWGIEDIEFSPDGKTIAAAWDDGTVRLFESDVPSGGYEPRKTVIAAKKIIEKLYNKHGLYVDVIGAIHSDATIEESVREVALQVAESRRWEDSAKLKDESWEVICTEGANIESYQKALEKARQANIFDPNNPSILSVLGGAQYRVGSYQDALQTLYRIEETQTDKKSWAGRLAFMAISLHQLGRDEEARDTLRRLHSLFEPRPTFYGEEVRSLLIEAEKLFAGENQTLRLVWEHIEKEEKGEAAKLVVQLRLLENEDYIESINRAAQWLAKLFFESGYSRFGSEYEYNEKIREYEIAIHMDPNYAEALHELALTYATCPVSGLRDSEKAIDTATKACELTKWKFHRYLSTLAIACSEASDFSTATEWQKKAIDLLSDDDLDDILPNYNAILELYESHRPYHKGSLWSFSDGELVAMWKFDEVEDGYVIDSSGHGLKGKLIGDALIVSDSQRGKVLSLDGTGDYVDCGKHPDFHITGSITISCWIKINDFNKEWQAIIEGGDAGWEINRVRDSNNIGFACYLTRPDHSLWSGSGKEWWTNTTQDKNVYDGLWHHVAGVYDGNEIYFYLDGTLGDYIYVRGNLSTETYPVYIGRNVGTPWNEWNGLIDDVRIYSYALSSEEVKMLYEGKEPPRKKQSEQ